MEDDVSGLSLRHTLTALLKIAAAALVIVGIAVAVVVTGPDGKVADSQADIYDLGLGFGRPGIQKRFGKALEQLGHDKPQAYDLDGNTIYFSVNYVDARPREVMRRYQEEFTLQGVNDRAYDDLDPDQADERLFTALSGGVVPQVISDDYITMGGMTMNGRATTPEEVIEQYNPTYDESQMFRGHRWVEMFWEPARHKTTVLASWSDDHFDYAKMVPGKANKGLSVDRDVPACPGCTRVNRMRDLDHKRLYSSNIFVSTDSPKQLLQFYHRAMSARGWKRRRSNAPLHQVQQMVGFAGNQTSVLSFHRPDPDDKRILTIVIFPMGHGQTAVHTSVSRNPHLASDDE